MPNYYQTKERQYTLGLPHITKVVKWLIIINIGVFVLQLLTRSFLNFESIFGLIPVRTVHGLALWQPFTYMFLHSGVWTLLIDVLILWMFGSDVETEFGPKLFAFQYISLSALAGIITVLLAPLSRQLILGPAASILGVLVAFGILFPERIVTLLLFFIIPVSIKAKYMVIGFVSLEILALINSPVISLISFVPLTAIPLSFIFVRYRFSINRFVEKSVGLLRKKREKKPDEHFIEKEIDPILDKISKHGLHSLTKKERKLLETARNKITLIDMPHR